MSFNVFCACRKHCISSKLCCTFIVIMNGNWMDKVRDYFLNYPLKPNILLSGYSGYYRLGFKTGNNNYVLLFATPWNCSWTDNETVALWKRHLLWSDTIYMQMKNQNEPNIYIYIYKIMDPRILRGSVINPTSMEARETDCLLIINRVQI